MRPSLWALAVFPILHTAFTLSHYVCALRHQMGSSDWITQQDGGAVLLAPRYLKQHRYAREKECFWVYCCWTLFSHNALLHSWKNWKQQLHVGKIFCRLFVKFNMQWYPKVATYGARFSGLYTIVTYVDFTFTDSKNRTLWRLVYSTCCI